MEESEVRPTQTDAVVNAESVDDDTAENSPDDPADEKLEESQPQTDAVVINAGDVDDIGEGNAPGNPADETVEDNPSQPDTVINAEGDDDVAAENAPEDPANSRKEESEGYSIPPAAVIHVEFVADDAAETAPGDGVQDSHAGPTDHDHENPAGNEATNLAAETPLDSSVLASETPLDPNLLAAESPLDPSVLSKSASESMHIDVVVTLRKPSVESSNGTDEVFERPSYNGCAQPTEDSKSAASEPKKNAVFSSILGRLRGTPSPVKSAAVPSSTTGLIFENRPSNLPAKSAAEEKKHRKQYEAMLEAAEQKKKKEASMMQREATDRIKREEVEYNRLSVWLNEILPHWESMHATRKTKDLWWSGIPTRIRGQVWKRALGNDLQITHDLYEISKSRAAEMIKFGVKTKDDDSENSSREPTPTSTPFLVSAKSRESSVQLIHLDVRRTFPQLGIFQEGGPLHSDLHDVLCAYSCYRPDMGYVQGMSFLAAVLILNMEPADAFICLANLLCKPVHMSLFRMDATQISLYFNSFAVLLDEALPRLSTHFKDQGIVPATFLVDWFFTSFSKSLPLEAASRVWDVYFRDGDEFLFRTGLGILHMYQVRMLEMEFGDLAHFFTHLPEDLSVEELFHSIGSVNMTTKRFHQIILQQRDRATASC